MSSALSDVSANPSTVGEFLSWADENPGRHELVDGRIYAKSPERVGHADAKFAVQTALKQAIQRAGLPCYMLPDGVTVRIGATTAYEPDALVFCGARLAPDTIVVTAPLAVVEVLSPSTGFYDRHNKLAGYFAVASIHHYLIVDIDRRKIVHHARDQDSVRTSILSSGPLRLDPPGLDLTVEGLLNAE